MKNPDQHNAPASDDDVVAERVRIFDTTLRDGEQAPGFSMDRRAKLRMAQQLEALGVDILEAGFPQASPDDFAAVAEIAGALKSTTVCALARCQDGDIDSAARALQDGAPFAHPPVPVDQPAASRAQAGHEQGAGAGHRGARDRTRPRLLRRGGVFRRGRAAHRAGIPGRSVQRRRGRRRHHAQRAGHGRLHHAGARSSSCSATCASMCAARTR